MEFYPTKKCSLDRASHETRVVTNLKGKTESAIALPFIEPHQASFLSETTNNSVTLQEASMCVCVRDYDIQENGHHWVLQPSPPSSTNRRAWWSYPCQDSFPSFMWWCVQEVPGYSLRFLFPHSLPYLILLPSFLLFSFPLLLCTHPFYFHFLSPLSSRAYFLPTLLTL